MSNHEIQNILKVEGINSKGFGTIPKLVMRDKRLSAVAKAIYAYFCSYAGAGTTAFPSVSLVLEDLGLAKDTYYKHLDQLKQCGYLCVRQQKAGLSNQFARNIYTLQSHPQQNLENSSSDADVCEGKKFASSKTMAAPVKAKDSKKKRVVHSKACICVQATDVMKSNHSLNQGGDLSNEPCPKIWDTENFASAAEPCPNFSDTEKQDTNSNSFKINSLNLSLCQKDGNKDVSVMIDALKTLAQEVLASHAPTIQISAQNIFSAEQVKQRFRQLTNRHFQYVATCVAQVKTEIFNLKSYLLAALYNAPITMDGYLRNQSLCGRVSGGGENVSKLLGMRRAPVFVARTIL